MNKTFIGGIAAMACLLGAAGSSWAQQPQQLSFPSQDGKSPPSTLRITEQPGAPAAPAVRDTPESVAEYQRCRAQVDREAIGNAQLQGGVAACLKELEQRRGR